MTDKRRTTVWFSEETDRQLVQLSSHGISQSDAVTLGIERLYRDVCQPVTDEQVQILSEAMKANRENRQEVLARLGKLALPPKGHSCPDCSWHSELFCLQIAIQRSRHAI